MPKPKGGRWSSALLRGIFILAPVLLIANLSIFMYHFKVTESLFRDWNRRVRPLEGNKLPPDVIRQLKENRAVSISSIFFLTLLGGGAVWLAHTLLIRNREQEEEAQKSILAMRERMQAVLNSAPLILWAVDSTGRCTMMEGLALSLLSPEARQLVGKNLFEELSSYPEIMSGLRRALQGETVETEMAFESRFYETTLIPITGKRCIKGMVGISVDVTDRKAREVEVELANQAKSQFLANMSHEIRTPLGLILGFIELLSGEGVSEEERLRYMGKVRLNAEALAALVNDILDLSKVEAGRVDVQEEDLPLNELLEDLRESFEMKAAGKGIRFVVDHAPHLPEVIHTDPTLLRQILVNLLGNSLKFTSQGEVRLRVESFEGRIPNQVQLTFRVTDTGIGISPDHQKMLFDPFRQGDPSTSRRFGGTGLGLALSRRLAELMGGDLQLMSSKIGGGSTFQLNLWTTLGTPKAAPSRAAKPTPMSLDHSQRLKDVRILLVEDAVDNQILVSTVLKRHGASVAFANDGREGIDKAVSGDWDLILMDIQMPGMDGFEATQTLRQRGVRIPILALTAHALREEKDRALQLGFSGYLTKPIDRAALISNIESFVHGEPDPALGLKSDFRQDHPETAGFPRA